MFDLTIHGERYCVLGEFWKEADGDQLLLRPGKHLVLRPAQQDKVKRLCNDDRTAGENSGEGISMSNENIAYA